MYKVLLVDDEPAILESERRAINNYVEDFEIIGEAYTVKQAIEIYEKYKADVILSDIKMPKQTGVDLFKYISEQDDNGSICIAVSGYSDFGYVHDAFMYGAYDYLLKPVEPAKLKDLFVRIYRLLIATKENSENLKLPAARISGKELINSIDSFVNNHLSDDNSIVQICSKFMISQPYLSKIFRKYKGCTYHEYLIGIKIDKAKELLHEGNYLIGEVAAVLGFTDQFYFSKVFKNTVGRTPREYKKEILE